MLLSSLFATALLRPHTLDSACCRRSAIGLAAAGFARPRPAQAAPFDWTFLWNAGPEAVPKQRSLPTSEVASRLERDLSDRKYILTGDLSPAIFADGCRFVDPIQLLSVG